MSFHKEQRSVVAGRDAERELIRRFCQGLETASGGLVIEGEAGIGKSTLWQVAVETAEDLGYRTLTSRPGEGETTLAYSGLTDLLMSQDDLEWVADLPAPQRDALQAALLLSEPEGAASDPRAIFTAFGAGLRALAVESPVLVAVDDVQWLDRSSLRALDFVARRLSTAGIGIIASARLTHADATADPAMFKLAQRMRLAPLSPGALHHVIRAGTGINLSRPVLLRLHRTAGGNPLLALETARALGVAGLTDARDHWPVPDDIRELVAARIAVLPGTVRSELLEAAALGQSAITTLRPSSLRAAERAGVVTRTDLGGTRFAHPLFASATYEQATLDERRRVHAKLARTADNVESRAQHAALACDKPDADVASMLDRAADSARRRGAPDVAAALTESAIAITRTNQPEMISRRRATAAEHCFYAGDLTRAKHLALESVDWVGLSGPERSGTLRLLGEISYRLGSFDDALRYLREAVDAAAGDPVPSALADIDLTFALVYSFGSFDEAAAVADRALTAAHSTGEASLISSALGWSLLTRFLLGGGLDEEALRRALSLEDIERAAPVERRPSFIAGYLLVGVGDFERSRSVLASLRDRLVERGEETDLPELLFLLARVECLPGNLSAAAALADQAYELAEQAGSLSGAASASAARAIVGAHAGHEAETRRAIVEATELAGQSGMQWAAFWASVAAGLLELSLENDKAVRDVLDRSIRLVEARGLPEPSRAPFLPDAIEALVRLGDIERADALTHLLEERGQALDRASVRLTSARCRALVLAARGDVAAARSILGDTVALDSPLLPPLEVARTLIVQGQLERRLKHKRAARESLARALALCEEIGAEAWAARARAELERVGRGPSPHDLTATEMRVAVLAASGLTNREIAAAAFLSEKTVEANLSRIYRKLDIRSRAGLGLALAERSSIPEAKPPE